MLGLVVPRWARKCGKTRPVEKAVVSWPLPKNYSSRSYESSLGGAASECSHNVTVNGDRYRAMLSNFFIPELNNHDVQELWFQQDGATCHTARATIDLLKDTFGDRLISRFGPVNWPPRSCDLTPLDYFCGAM
ncbi:hypothetical protein TNCV_2817611 [Trichonephila clavipes]|nr:hypothetical protein TNCV_2817611 [Trichonephila clavipes]